MPTAPTRRASSVQIFDVGGIILRRKRGKGARRVGGGNKALRFMSPLLRVRKTFLELGMVANCKCSDGSINEALAGIPSRQGLFSRSLQQRQEGNRRSPAREKGTTIILRLRGPSYSLAQRSQVFLNSPRYGPSADVKDGMMASRFITCASALFKSGKSRPPRVIPFSVSLVSPTSFFFL